VRGGIVGKAEVDFDCCGDDVEKLRRVGAWLGQH